MNKSDGKKIAGVGGSVKHFSQKYTQHRRLIHCTYISESEIRKFRVFHLFLLLQLQLYFSRLLISGVTPAIATVFYLQTQNTMHGMVHF